MFPFATELEDALVSLVNKPQRQRGQLGYLVRGVYSVITPDPTKFYVRLASGELVLAAHRSRVPPLQDLDVWVVRKGGNRVEIEDVDWDKAYLKFGNFAATLGVGLHTHVRFSGLEFPVDTRLLAPLQLRWSGVVVSLNPGFYSAAGELYWWDGTQTLDLTTSGFGVPGYTWQVLVLDTTSLPHVLTVGATSELYANLTDLTSDQLPDLVNALDDSQLPVAAVRLRNGATALYENAVESLLDLWVFSDAPGSLSELHDVVDAHLTDLLLDAMNRLRLTPMGTPGFRPTPELIRLLYHSLR